MKVYIYILSLTFLFYSCRKDIIPISKLSKYSGTYIGESDVYSWNMIDGVTTDTTYTDTLEVISEGNYLPIYWQKKLTLIVSKRMLLTLKV